MQQKIKNSPKERKKNRQREYSLVCVGKIYIVWKKEKKNYSKKKNEKKSQNKRNMKGWRN